MKGWAAPVALAVAMLVLGFSLIPTDAGQWMFEELARGIAATSRSLLALLKMPASLSGTEIRSLTTGHAVDVTSVCDGHGLLVSWAALILATARSTQSGLWALLAGAILIQAVNILRVVVLFLVVPAGPQAFEFAHIYVFPILTGATMLALFAGLSGANWRIVAAVLALVLVLATLWYSVQHGAAAVLLVPIAEMYASVRGEMCGLLSDGQRLRCSTGLLTGPDALTLTLYPADYLLAIPLLLAALGLQPRAFWILPVAILGMGVALVLSIETSTWVHAAHALRSGQDLLDISTDAAYVPPNGFTEGSVRLAQNVIVHFNLLVLPMLILARGGRRDDVR